MKHTPTYDIEHGDEAAPRFRASVERCKRENTVLLVNIRGFAGEADLLYQCLWYATEQGVSVQFAPDLPEEAS